MSDAIAIIARTLIECEAVIERGQQTFVEVGEALLEIRDRRLYHKQGYTAFEDYCQQRWGWSRIRAHQLIEGATVAGLLTTVNSLPPANEAQARELVPLLHQGEQEVVDVWRDLKEQYGDRVTAEKVKRLVSNRMDEIKRKETLAERQLARESNPLSANAKLICSDFRLVDIVPGSVDTIITDPPYPKEYLPLYTDLARLATEWLRPGGSLLVMVGQSYLPTILSQMTPYLAYQWTLAYLTPGGGSPQIWQRKVNTFWKPVLWFVNGPYSGDWIGDVCKSDASDKRFHQWGQSESGMRSIVERFSTTGQLIVDPFLGGGTTGVVAIALGRRFIGIDKDQSAIDTAKDRIANAGS